jgi:hypothetical protein
VLPAVCAAAFLLLLLLPSQCKPHNEHTNPAVDAHLQRLECCLLFAQQLPPPAPHQLPEVVVKRVLALHNTILCMPALERRLAAAQQSCQHQT